MNNIDVTKLKNEYGEIYKVNIYDVDYIYRKLTTPIFLKIYNTSHSDVEFEDLVIGEVLLYPGKEIILNSPRAGEASALFKCIMNSSNFPNVAEWNDIVANKKITIVGDKDPTTDPIIGRVITITDAFKITPKELLNLPIDEILELNAWAEIKLEAMQKVLESNQQKPTKQPKNGVSYTKQELEEIGADISSKALEEEMRKHARNRSR